MVGVSACTPKGCGFDPGSGHIPRLWPSQSVCRRQLINVSPSLSPSLPLSLKALKTALSEDKKIEYKVDIKKTKEVEINP